MQTSKSSKTADSEIAYVISSRYLRTGSV